MPNILPTHKAHDLLISLNHQYGPYQVHEPKGHEPCSLPSIMPQHLNPQLPLALAKPSSPNSGPCHNISLAHAEPTPSPCQPTCRATPMATPQ
ncbi:hypothetical protein PS1_003496 [Malus domestica]